MQISWKIIDNCRTNFAGLSKQKKFGNIFAKEMKETLKYSQLSQNSILNQK